MQRHPTASGPPVAHLYARISDPTQRKGSGLERQTTNDAEGFCRQFNFTLSKRVFVDDGVSAWKGLNATPKHQLGQFLAEAGRGLIRPGDCLLLENYDRLSRQDPWAAISLVNDLRQLGLHVGRLDRMKLLRCDSTDVGDFFEAAIELMRGNSESEMKSVRNRAAWEKKRKVAREQGKPMTRHLPAWVEERGGKLHLIPERAAVVKLIFHLASNGYGQHSIIKKLTTDGIPSFGQALIRPGRKRSHFSGKWRGSYIDNILNDRRAVGEFQPCKGRKPDGPPIKGYFPAAVSEQEWWAAQAGQDKRRKKAPSGKDIPEFRQGKYVNLFPGLLKNAREQGDTYIAASTHKAQNRIIKSRAAHQGEGAAPYSFPLPVFEAAILTALKQIDPHSILNGDQGPDDSLTLASEFGKVEAELAEASAWMDEHGFSPTIAKRIADLETRKTTLAEQLADARQRAAHPLSECWGACQTLVSALKNAPDQTDARLRLRAAIRRIIDSVYLLVVPRGRDRLCLAQTWFAGGKKYRTHLILYRAAERQRPGRWWFGSVDDFTENVQAELFETADLRKPDGVKDALDFLTNYPAAVLTEQLAKGKPLP